MASHLEKPYVDPKTSLPQTERAALECVQLPMHSALSEADVNAVIEAIDQIYSRM